MIDQVHSFIDAIYSAFTHVPGPMVAAISSLATLYLNRWWRKHQARKRWNQKNSLSRVNVSFNILVDGKLKIRTILERSIDDIVDNEDMRDRLFAAAGRCTENEPLIDLPEEEHGFVLRCFQNAVAERFTAGYARYDSGHVGRSTMYVIFLTCEPKKGDRHRKIRVMLLKRDTIEVFPYLERWPLLESDKHADRIRTLRRAAEVYKTNPKRFAPLEIFT